MDLETQRLVIRSIIKEDIAALVELWTDRDVTAFSGGPRDRQKVQAAFEDDISHPTDEPQWSIIHKADNRLIGYCALIEKEIAGRNETEIVYFFNKDVWRQGFATEAASAILSFAFTVLELRRVVALIHPDNLPSEKVGIKLGMVFEKEIERHGQMKKMFVIERHHFLKVPATPAP